MTEVDLLRALDGESAPPDGEAQPDEGSQPSESAQPGEGSPSSESALPSEGSSEGSPSSETAESSESPQSSEGSTSSEVETAASDDADAKGPGPGQALDDEALLQGAAALLFASPDPLTLDRLVALLERPARSRVRDALAALAARLEESRLPIALLELAGGYRLLTRPDHGEIVQRLTKVPRAEKVTPAALETLAIVAYRQPVTNAEVEAIRGVQSGAMLRTLVDRGLVRVTGRADQPGAPLQYGTTKEFLERFGLASLRDLPRDGELAKD